MFAALIPMVAQLLGPILNKVLGSVTSGLNQPKKSESVDHQKDNSDKNFLKQQDQNLFSSLAHKVLGNILGGFGSAKA